MTQSHVIPKGGVEPLIHDQALMLDAIPASPDPNRIYVLGEDYDPASNNQLTGIAHRLKEGDLVAWEPVADHWIVIERSECETPLISAVEFTPDDDSKGQKTVTVRGNFLLQLSRLEYSTPSTAKQTVSDYRVHNNGYLTFELNVTEVGEYNLAFSSACGKVDKKVTFVRPLAVFDFTINRDGTFAFTIDTGINAVIEHNGTKVYEGRRWSFNVEESDSVKLTYRNTQVNQLRIGGSAWTDVATGAGTNTYPVTMAFSGLVRKVNLASAEGLQKFSSVISTAGKPNLLSSLNLPASVRELTLSSFWNTHTAGSRAIRTLDLQNLTLSRLYVRGFSSVNQILMPGFESCGSYYISHTLIPPETIETFYTRINDAFKGGCALRAETYGMDRQTLSAATKAAIDSIRAKGGRAGARGY